MAPEEVDALAERWFGQGGGLRAEGKGRRRKLGVAAALLAGIALVGLSVRPEQRPAEKKGTGYFSESKPAPSAPAVVRKSSLSPFSPAVEDELAPLPLPERSAGPSTPPPASLRASGDADIFGSRL